jgi:hypothetical protein
MSILLNIFIGICSFSGIASLYLYFCKYYTIKNIKELEQKLSQIKDITEEEYNILLSMRQFLKEN